jgi:hypothetical protein
VLGEVDSEPQGRVTGCSSLEVQRVPTAFLQHPAPDLDDQARLLGQGDELIGLHEAARRMIPAAERLDPACVAALQLDERLEVQL